MPGPFHILALRSSSSLYVGSGFVGSLCFLVQLLSPSKMGDLVSGAMSFSPLNFIINVVDFFF